MPEWWHEASSITQDPLILGTTIQNLVAQDLCTPGCNCLWVTTTQVLQLTSLGKVSCHQHIFLMLALDAGKQLTYYSPTSGETYPSTW